MALVFIKFSLTSGISSIRIGQKSGNTFQDFLHYTAQYSQENRRTYCYDAAGNRNQMTYANGVVTTYRYDGENRLLLVTIQEGNSVTTERYTYDAFGNRVSKTVNEEETQYYVVDSGTALAQVSAKVTADGKTITSYLRGEDLICMESDGKVWYYVADGHGSIRALLDGEGNITDRYSYDAFGNVLTRQGSTENDYRYTGEEYNELTGLYYLRARYMDPSTGTFISMDSYPGRMNDPVSLHRYLYANANPVMYTDPTGYFALTDFMAAGGIQSALGGVQISVCLHKLMAMANVACTVYDTAMEIKHAILGGGSIGDILFAMLKGAAVGYVIENICKSPLGLVLRPVFVVFGIGNQFDLIMKAFESGDPVEITVRLVQMLVMVYGISQQCFTGETLVAAEDGLKPIGEVKAGELVWSENVETGEAELREVLSVSISCTDTLVHVETSSGAFINTTAGHPFYVEGKGWVTASELAAGDVLRTRDGEGQTVASVSTEKLEEPVKVYNLEVEEGHTYYVTDGNVLVHNNCGGKENGVQNNGESGKKTGGAYKDVPANGGQVHHMPADSVSPYSNNSGPSIRMDTPDHMKTASWGRSKAAQAYRAIQKELMDKGLFREVQQMDIENVRALFGNKYDEAIQQMLEYTEKLLK